ncbi:DUF5329 domain-containing protein [Pelomonas sp. UHG3]|uniref:DUF5329 domain-containing protein n=1 Tax=Roseateles hydrophilus TaxID=2975054 RepID=A0ACC6CBF8_9BURK|nr:DUF5329 domain-containing protein [Pelomonas sp. UHG3]MCY4745736.1 DUF5329 domain-containing protein [Pelomonas sp. UHG3]
MRRPHPLLLALPLALLLQAASAAPLPAVARAEIDALLARLQASGCEFNRNGSWHAGAEARAHLLKKLDVMAGRGLVASAEQFIERGATSSSMSGQPYRVRCAGQAPVDSAPWLKAELQALRAARAASSPR